MLDPASFDVTYRGQRRHVRCAACDQTVSASIVPHLKREHPDEWSEWVDRFIQLRAAGLTFRAIMWEFNRLFSWTVIRNELGLLDPMLSSEVPVKEWLPTDFRLEETTLWRFPARGRWANHTSYYPGNWPPQVARNLIVRFSKPGDVILDPFVGGGTTLIEALLLERHSIGLDINPQAVRIAEARINGLKEAGNREGYPLASVRAIVLQGDARCIPMIPDKSVNLICTHPPYLDAVEYSRDIPGDLSRLRDDGRYLDQFRSVAKEFRRVLRADGRCAIMMGDVRRNGRLVPLAFRVFHVLQEEGFQVQETAIKEQERCSFNEFYSGKNGSHLRIAHEYIYVFSA